MKGLLQRVIKWIFAHSPQWFLLWIIRSQKWIVSDVARSHDVDRHGGTEASKEMLISLVELESSIDNAVNQAASIYYKGKHPKHCLWSSHNDFIVDNIKSGESVIDIGCGASQYPLRLAEKGAKVLCVDNNAARIETSEKNNVHPNLTYKLMDVTDKVPDEVFDTAVCSHILEHLDDPVIFLKKLNALASRIIIKVPRVDSGWKKLMKKDIGMFWLDDTDHRKEYTWDILLKELDLSGWKPIKKETGLDIRVIVERKE